LERIDLAGCAAAQAVGKLIAVWAGGKKNSIWSELPHLPLLNDIRIATINGLNRSMIPKWARPYHGNVTEHGEQSEVEGKHVSVILICRIVRS
jgi:hypothetical protein